MIKGKTRYSRRSGDSNSRYVTTAIPMSNPTSCTPVVKVSAGAVERGTRLSRNGATSITPIASPVHHTAHVAQKFERLTVPDTTSTDAPTVALSVIATSAARTMMAAASRRRSSSRRKPMRLRSSAAATGASVLPAAISTALIGVGPIGRFTANAPTKMPSAIERPKMRTATRAIPVGGQMGVTWPWTRASERLARAASQYTTATTTRRGSVVRIALTFRPLTPTCAKVSVGTPVLTN